jgi:hypothetical protein
MEPTLKMKQIDDSLDAIGDDELRDVTFYFLISSLMQAEPSI